jgi:selenocysteine lyase/cysteine desulfurase
MQGGLFPLRSLGPQRIFEHVAQYLDALEPKMQALDLESKRSPRADRCSGILSFATPPGIAAGKLAQAISERGVSVSSPDGLLRFAPHFANSLGEVSDVAAVVAEALKACQG